ncbi:MAG: NUDIX domain-containing protein [Flavobacteriales bacterium]|nr:NUDIX domain-containing protein [Flavobacteriales bacterium]
MNAPTFTIRVYGLLLHAGHVLVSDELIKGRRITKFPGGGLEYGEGLKDCLIREIREEIGIEALDRNTSTPPTSSSKAPSTPAPCR